MLLSDLLIFIGYSVFMLILVMYLMMKNIGIGVFVAAVLTLIGYMISVPIFSQVASVIIWILLFMSIIVYTFMLKEDVT